MIPIAIDPSAVPLGLVGRSPRLLARLRWLEAGGAASPAVFADEPDDDLAAAAGDRLVPRLPRATELAGLGAIWVVGLPGDLSAEIARTARAAGALVNVEDVPSLCDFHTPAIVRRGDLLLTVSTGGRSPAVAARIRGELERTYGPGWAGRLDRVARDRDARRQRGASMAELVGAAGAVLAAEEKAP